MFLGWMVGGSVGQSVAWSVSWLVGQLISISVLSDWFISPLPWILGPSKTVPVTQEKYNMNVLNKQTKVDSIL